MKKILILSLLLCMSVVFSQKKNNKSNVIIEIKNKTVEEVKTHITDKKIDLESEEEVDVPFQIIENPPVFPGCENTIDKRACFQENLIKHILKKLIFPKELINEPITKFTINFIIEKNSSISNIKLSKPNSILENEIKRVLELLTVSKAGKHRGVEVRTLVSIPIHLNLQD